MTTSLLWSGSTSASTRSMPRRRATASAVTRLSPVSMTTSMPSARSACRASGVVSLTGSAMAMSAGDRAVDADEDDGGPVAAEPVGLARRASPGSRPSAGQEGGAAEQDPAALDGADDALAGRGVEVGDVGDRQAGVAGGVHDGQGEGVLGGAFDGGREPQQLVLGEPGRRGRRG